MQTKKKIGLLTWYHSINYGTCLQAYALYKYLSDKEYDVYLAETVRYKTVITVKDTVRRVIKKCKNRFFHKKENATVIPHDIESQYQLRRDKMFSFSKENMNIFSIKSKADFKKFNNFADIFVTGSDQIWNPYYLSLPCLLNFVENGKKKIAYASSIGVADIPNDLKKVYKKYLSRFDCLSVREANAAKLLSDITAKKVDVVADPTFLFKKADLIKLAETAAPSIDCNEDYILCYFLSTDISWAEKVREIAELSDMKVIVILSELKVIPNIGTPLASAGINEFLYLMDKAKIICTDSFHCTALSINLEKSFFVFKRFKDSDINSQNTRIYDLLNKFGFENRLIDNSSEISKCLLDEIDFSKANILLDELRNHSETYLRCALEENDADM